MADINESLARGIAQAEAGDLIDKGSFAEHLDKHLAENVPVTTLTDEQMVEIKADIDAAEFPGTAAAIAVLSRLFGQEVWAQAQPDELDPTSVPIPHNQWEQIATWALERQREITPNDRTAIVGASLAFMNWGPSAA